MSQSPTDSVRRRNIERLIELIYDTPDEVRRRTLVALLAEEEAARSTSIRRKPAA